MIPFHAGLLKVKGNIDGFAELKEELCLIDAPMQVKSQGGSCLRFQSVSEDLRLKEWISVKITECSLSGRER
jgi:hypothetical protein